MRPLRRAGQVRAAVCPGVLTDGAAVGGYGHARIRDGRIAGDGRQMTDIDTVTAAGDAASGQSDTGELIRLFRQTRARTLGMVGTLEGDDFAVQTAPYTSPPKWHLGHVSWMYEAILGRMDPAYEPHPADLSGYLNSYYNQFGRPGDKDRRGAVSRPATGQILGYFDAVTDRVAAFLEKNGTDKRGEALFVMGLHHECQHQELLAYDLQHMLAERYRPAERCRPRARQRPPVQNLAVGIPGGLYDLGHAGGGFCYDVELPEHRVYLDDYVLDGYPVSNGEYLQFIEDGGYGDYRHWLSDGWDRVRENGWDSPMYWELVDGVWHTRDFGGVRRINPNEPVVHVSFYEADAFCRWAGRRLPTEAEWEKAACCDPETGAKTAFPWGDAAPSAENCNLLESHLWRCSELGSYPDGKSRSGCHHMIGDVWEWTSSEFVGYPGFRSGFQEYNDKWFTNQKVLRGGSFGTPRMSIRGSYRNFFRLDERWMFSGFRCAGDT